MVKLTKIYTKTGDGGETGLGDGSRVTKTDPRVEAYGSVDEANAAIGLAAVSCGQTQADIRGLLLEVQNDLFDVGADLCTPRAPDEAPGSALRVLPEQTRRLEEAIDRFNAALPSLTSFVLPGGTELAARLHVARTVTRRAERRTVEFAATLGGDGEQAAEPIRYLNRLSDLLFVLSRCANGTGGGDVLWVPGRSRDDSAP
ncbi:MAG: cob(I)yrinic acid a,c-diamide adenosyltransferase [Phycisphaerales bacterium]